MSMRLAGMLAGFALGVMLLQTVPVLPRWPLAWLGAALVAGVGVVRWQARWAWVRKATGIGMVAVALVAGAGYAGKTPVER